MKAVSYARHRFPADVIRTTALRPTNFSLSAPGARDGLIDAQAGAAGAQAFTFIAGAAFTAEGQVRAVQSGAHTVIEINTTGVGVADMTIQLSNFAVANLTAADFIL
ncbi:MAG: hypothetical protein ACKVP5_14090 [Aestuariivirga sp.]